MEIPRCRGPGMEPSLAAELRSYLAPPGPGGVVGGVPGGVDGGVLGGVVGGVPGGVVGGVPGGVVGGVPGGVVGGVPGGVPGAGAGGVPGGGPGAGGVDCARTSPALSMETAVSSFSEFFIVLRLLLQFGFPRCISSGRHSLSQMGAPSKELYGPFRPSGARCSKLFDAEPTRICRSPLFPNS